MSSEEFDWRVYADATCAGLSVLIPVPLIDLAFESFFQRRMPVSICRARSLEISPVALEVLRRRRGDLFTFRGCLTLPVIGVLYLLKRLSRKILYFLTIREATEQLSYYWHRAFLLDHVARRGHLRGRAAGVALAREAMERTLESAETSPLMQLARSTVRGAHRVFRMLLRARRKGASPEIRAREAILESHWNDVSAHFEELATAYDSTLAALIDGQEARGGT